MFLTTEFYDHMRELNRSGGEMRHSEGNPGYSGKNEEGRITEEFTLCYEDGDKSY
jgi:predicted methyltransferase